MTMHDRAAGAFVIDRFNLCPGSGKLGHAPAHYGIVIFWLMHAVSFNHRNRWSVAPTQLKSSNITTSGVLYQSRS
jgi:hypothetical protein